MVVISLVALEVQEFVLYNIKIMKQPDLQLTIPNFKGDPQATRQMAAYTAKLQDILRDIYDNLGTVPVVTAAPAATELDEKGDPNAEVRSDFKILHDATQSNRKVYYKKAGTVYVIDSA